MSDDKEIPELSEVERARWEAAQSALRSLAEAATSGALDDETLVAAIAQTRQIDLNMERIRDSIHILEGAGEYREALIALQARFLVQVAVLEMRYGSRVLADPWPSVGWRLGTDGDPADPEAQILPKRWPVPDSDVDVVGGGRALVIDPCFSTQTFEYVRVLIHSNMSEY